MKLVKDFMTQDFKRLDSNLTPQDALAFLNDGCCGVIEDVEHQPMGIVTRRDIEAAITANATSLAPVVLQQMLYLKVGCETAMQTVVKSTLLPTLVQGQKAALVMDGSDQVVGVLSVDALSQFIQSGMSQLEGTTMGGEGSKSAATELAGDFAPLTAYCICRKCWYRNQIPNEQWLDLQEKVIDSVLCQNPNIPAHSLKLG